MSNEQREINLSRCNNCKWNMVHIPLGDFKIHVCEVCIHNPEYKDNWEGLKDEEK